LHGRDGTRRLEWVQLPPRSPRYAAGRG
jgi:hypothetical protein